MYCTPASTETPVSAWLVHDGTPQPLCKQDKKKQAEEDKIRLAKEAEEAKKRELAAKYGDSSDEDTATPLPGASTPARAGAAATASAALDDDEMF